VAGTAVQADGASSLLAVALAGEGDGTRSLQIPASLGVVLACVWGSKNKPKRRRNSRKKSGRGSLILAKLEITMGQIS